MSVNPGDQAPKEGDLSPDGKFKLATVDGALEWVPLEAPTTVANVPAGEEAPNYVAYYYCLEQEHPGAPRFDTDPLSVARIFGVEVDEGCPVCPACGKQVTARLAPGPDQPPADITEYADRVGRAG